MDTSSHVVGLPVVPSLDMWAKYGSRQFVLVEFVMLALKSCVAQSLFDFPLDFGSGMIASVLGYSSLSVKSKACDVQKDL